MNVTRIIALSLYQYFITIFSRLKQRENMLRFIGNYCCDIKFYCYPAKSVASLAKAKGSFHFFNTFYIVNIFCFLIHYGIFLGLPRDGLTNGYHKVCSIPMHTVKSVTSYKFTCFLSTFLIIISVHVIIIFRSSTASILLNTFLLVSFF